MLVLTLKPGESVKIGDIAVVTLQEKSGNVARLAVQADKSIPITRVQSTSQAQIAAKEGLGGAMP